MSFRPSTSTTSTNQTTKPKAPPYHNLERARKVSPRWGSSTSTAQLVPPLPAQPRPHSRPHQTTAHPEPAQTQQTTTRLQHSNLKSSRRGRLYWIFPLKSSSISRATWTMHQQQSSACPTDRSATLLAQSDFPPTFPLPRHASTHVTASKQQSSAHSPAPGIAHGARNSTRGRAAMGPHQSQNA